MGRSGTVGLYVNPKMQSSRHEIRKAPDRSEAFQGMQFGRSALHDEVKLVVGGLMHIVPERRDVNAVPCFGVIGDHDQAGNRLTRSGRKC